MIKLTEILKKILINEYNKSQLDYIALKLNIPRTSDFESILSALDAKGIKYSELKDKILKGEIKTLEDLETLRGTPKRIKAGKINTGEADANLVYNQDNLRVYWGKDKNACVKYGNGYSFCISARGDYNAYMEYRINTGTPYFVFDDTKTSDIKNDKNKGFVDPTHLLVVYVTNANPTSYEVTIADNDIPGEFSSFDKLKNEYPRLSKLKDVLKFVNPNPKEQKRINRDNYIFYLTNKSKDILGNNTYNFSDVLYSLDKLIEFQNGTLPLYSEDELKNGEPKFPTYHWEWGYFKDIIDSTWWTRVTKARKITKEGNKIIVYLEPYEIEGRSVGARVMAYEKIPYPSIFVNNKLLDSFVEEVINYYKTNNIKKIW
jgi:hypothetical protein